jgi:hypothetical protein
MLLEQLRWSWYASSPTYACVAITTPSNCLIAETESTESLALELATLTANKAHPLKDQIVLRMSRCKGESGPSSAQYGYFDDGDDQRGVHHGSL